MTVLALAHVTDDVNQSFIPALLPYLILERHLSHETAATLVFWQAVSSSVIQPAIGVVADRRSMPWLIAVGILLAGSGVALLGVLPTLPLLFLAALASGIGVATFHPEAARFANYVSGDKKASGMRWFTVGGNLGFALGPAFATAAISMWGMHGTLAASVPVTILGGIVFLEIPRLRTFVPAHVKRRTSAGHDDWLAFGKLSAFVILRSMAYIGSVSFVPLFLVEALHASPAVGDGVLMAFLLAGAAGTIAGGPIADRIGRKPVILCSTALTALLFGALVLIGPAGGIVVAVPWLLVTGFVFVAAQASFVVLGQEYLPNRVGLASGVTLGLAVSLGGAFTPVLGMIADRWGVGASIATVAALALGATLIALTLPRETRQQAKAAAAQAVA